MDTFGSLPSKDSLIIRLNQWSQIAVLATIPMEPILINNILIIIWSITVFIKPNFERRTNITRFLIPFILYFFVHLLGLIHSNEVFSIRGLKYIENKIAFIFLPLLIIFSHPIDLKKGLNIFTIVASCLCALCLIKAVVNNLMYNEKFHLSISHINPWFYSYKLYSSNVGLHPTYFSIFLLFCLISLLGWRRAKRLTYLQWGMTIFISINILLLTSRLMIAIAIVYFGIFITFGLTTTLAKKAVIILLSVLVIAIIMANPVAQKRIRDIVENEQSTFSGFNLKLRMWTALYDEVISKNLILGIGPINQNEYIKSVYKKYQIKEAYKHAYNSHNQYIDNLLYHGLFGLLVLLLLYLNNFLYGIVKRDYLLISIVMIFAVGSLTESLFLRQKGIVFFSFIVPLLFFNSFEHPQTKEKNNLP